MPDLYPAVPRRNILTSVLRRWQPNLIALLFFILATIVMLWPLSIQWGDHVPDWGDPLENAWVLAWDAHQLVINPLALYNANIFYPYSNSLAFSESQVGSALLGLPLFFSSNNAILSYNFVFLLSFVLSGFGAYLLAYDLTRNRWGAVLAGIGFAFCPYRMNHLSHINLVTLQWLPLALMSLRRSLISDRPGMRLLFAVSFVLQALASWYAALMTGLGLGLYVLYYLLSNRRHLAWRRLGSLALVGVICLALVLVIAWPYFQVSQDLGFARSIREAERLSAQPISFLSVPSSNRLYGNLLSEPWPEALFPGVVLFVLAIVGAFGKKSTADRAFWVSLVALFAILALGPTLRLSSTLPPLSMPYRLLYDYVPGFQGTRAPARLFVMGLLGMSVLGAAGLGWIAVRARSLFPLVAIVAVVLLAAEYNVAPLQIASIETGNSIPPVYHWLATQPEGNLLELPVQVGDVIPITRAMYFSTCHWHPTLLGYGSFTPQSQVELLTAINSSFDSPQPRFLNILREFSVQYLLLHQNEFKPDDWPRIQAQLSRTSGLTLLHSDAADFVYQVQGPAPAHPLTYTFVLPAHMDAGSQALAYVLVQQPRNYPIVTAGQLQHQVKVAWSRTGVPVSTQTFTIKTPELLPNRPQSIPVFLRVPDDLGSYQLDWTLDGKPLSPIDGNRQALVNTNMNSEGNGPDVELVLYSVDRKRAAPGDQVVLTLYWRRTREIRNDYDVSVSLLDASGNEQTTLKRQPVMWLYPFRLWRNYELVADAYALPVPSNGEPGDWHIAVGLTPSGEEAALPFRDPSGATVDQFQLSLPIEK